MGVGGTGVWRGAEGRTISSMDEAEELGGRADCREREGGDWGGGGWSARAGRESPTPKGRRGCYTKYLCHPQHNT